MPLHHTWGPVKPHPLPQSLHREHITELHTLHGSSSMFTTVFQNLSLRFM